MSMTQTVLFRQEDFPRLKKIQEFICENGYTFELNEINVDLDNIDGLEFKVNGQEDWCEANVQSVEEFITEYPELAGYRKDSNKCISFVWGASMVAGTAIAMISWAMAELANATVIYVDEFAVMTKEEAKSSVDEFLERM